MNRHLRAILLITVDIILVNLSIVTALMLRFDGAVPAQFYATYREMALVYTAIWVGTFYFLGLYKKLWQYASIGELISIIGAVTFGAAANIAYTYFIMDVPALPMPRSVFLLAWLLNIVFVGGSRLAWRLFRDYAWVPSRGGKPVLIVGAGAAGAMVARELKSHYGNQYNLVGFVDDDPDKQHLYLYGIPVLGVRADIPDLVSAYAIQEIIVAIPSAPGRVIREIVEICRETTAQLRILPGVYELIDGKVALQQLREVQVEDLLGREPVQIDLEEIAGYLEQAVVLVTGAGGSIGSELCRQVARFNPSRLILLGHDENPIFETEQELRYLFPSLHLETVIADVKDRLRIDQVFSLYKPQVVFHAAAHKHVPLMEANPGEAMKNNILGTYNVALTAGNHGANTFVLISTDKAVNPTSIMGATKRVAEMVIQSLNGTNNTRYVAVRFGNVLGSRGSVIPTFKEQIARGGPVTVTHPEMTRYFMTIPEAVQLVIQAGAMAKGGEIFVLDMGKPVKIIDLAYDLIRLSGLEPEVDIEIKFIGMRPGEKLYEELLTAEEGTTATKHKRIFVAKPNGVNPAVIEDLINRIADPNFLPTDAEAETLLSNIVPEMQRNKPTAKVQVS